MKSTKFGGSQKTHYTTPPFRNRGLNNKKKIYKGVNLKMSKLKEGFLTKKTELVKIK